MREMMSDYYRRMLLVQAVREKWEREEAGNTRGLVEAIISEWANEMKIEEKNSK